MKDKDNPAEIFSNSAGKSHIAYKPYQSMMVFGQNLFFFSNHERDWHQTFSNLKLLSPTGYDSKP